MRPSRDQTVDALVATLAHDAGKRAKVARYYHELECGLLPAGRVSRRAFDALAAMLSARAPDLALGRPHPPAAEGSCPSAQEWDDDHRHRS